MSVSRKCDFCGKEFGFGTKVTLGLSGTVHNDFNISPFRQYTGEYDICIDCIKKVQNILNCQEGISNNAD